MKILLYAPNYLPATRYGGPIRSSHGLAKALVQLGHRVHVLTTNVDGPSVLDVPIDQPVTRDGVVIRYFPVVAPRRIYRAPKMGRVFNAEIAEFDVAHINGMYLWPGPRLASAAYRVGVPTVISPRGMLAPELIAGKSTFAKRIWIALMERPHLARAQAIHVTSEDEANDVRRLRLDLAPLTIIGNGVEVPHTAPQQKDIDRVWTGIPSGLRVAFLGRLDWTKGVDLAIRAVRVHSDAQILIAGSDQIGLRADLEAQLIRDDGTKAGRFIGEVNGTDKWALLAGADVLLAPSLRESFGLSVAEALAMGTPVICTSGVGAKSIVERSDSGAIVERTPEALAQALTEFLADPERRSCAGTRGSNIIREEFAWESIARQMITIYKSTETHIK